ncbi:MAG: DUF1993 domain-containing protein [Burkholderiaceae bacterium]|nr:DUF1993 domain-containing protein [Burkholderiaceae bacterium]
MTISMYAASVPVFKQMLGGLSHVLAKAEAHATAKKIDPTVLLQSRLYPDMFNLTRQVQIAGDFAKGTCARLAGAEVPSYADSETTFAELQARIVKTLAFIEAIPAASIDGSEARQIVTQAGTPREKIFAGQSYLLNYSLPHFFFHTTTAYAILRHNGVEIGKKDFIGTY